MSTLIRKEVAADVPAIDAVTVEAFRNALHSGHTEQFILNALRESGQLSVSLVAVENGAVVGHVAVSLPTGEVAYHESFQAQA